MKTKILANFQICINVPLITFKKVLKQPPEKFCKKLFLNIFVTFTKKYKCWRLFLIQNIAKFFRASILKNICERLLLKTKLFMKLRKVKNCWYCKGFWLGIKKTGFFNISIRDKWKCISLCFCFMIVFLLSLYLHTIFFALNFGQWKNISRKL